ncbi:MAG TPA: SEC-C metal-binding domain-containing protein [Candidatus Angelobacter sp.]|nr:SEC-C metal-binding domain-containing protein [Candidatus Angelobacter sp.]
MSPLAQAYSISHPLGLNESRATPARDSVPKDGAPDIILKDRNAAARLGHSPVTGRLQNSPESSLADFLKDRNAPKAGRNDPCPCGSGKKHKKCHSSLEKVEARAKLLAPGRAARGMPQLSLYKPRAAHGYGSKE